VGRSSVPSLALSGQGYDAIVVGSGFGRSDVMLWQRGGDGLLLGPLRGGDPPGEVVEGLLRNVDAERTDFDGGFDRAAYDELPSSRSGLKAACSSVAKSSGSSHAAK